MTKLRATWLLTTALALTAGPALAGKKPSEQAQKDAAAHARKGNDAAAAAAAKRAQDRAAAEERAQRSADRKAAKKR
jgi:hypothetical protein